MKKKSTYSSSGFVIVQVHQTATVAFDLARVWEAFCQSCARLDVGRTSAPLPVGMSRTLICHLVFAHVASARINGTSTAALTDRICYGRTPHRVQIGRFATTCNSWFKIVFIIPSFKSVVIGLRVNCIQNYLHYQSIAIFDSSDLPKSELHSKLSALSSFSDHLSHFL